MTAHSIQRALDLQEQADERESRGDLTGAEECCRQAITIFLELEGPEGKLILMPSLALLGTALRQQAQYDQAEPPLRRALVIAEEAGDVEEIVNALNSLGVLFKFSGNFDEAANLYQRALDLALQTFEAAHRTVATLYHNIGGLDHARGRFAAAEAPARRAWELNAKLLGPDHPQTAADAVAYGAVLVDLGRAGEAVELYRHALAIFERVFGREHFEVASTLIVSSNHSKE
jgi:tetratricopeptide (TPR) repeat protein